MLYSSHSSTPDACIPPLWRSLADFGGCQICACDSFYRCLTRGVADASRVSRHAAEVKSFMPCVNRKLLTVLNTQFVSIRFLHSGGQKQRVAIARVMLKDPPICVLDEGRYSWSLPMRIFSPPCSFTALRFVVATSALDARSEYHINQALHAMTKGRTGMDPIYFVLHLWMICVLVSAFSSPSNIHCTQTVNN